MSGGASSCKFQDGVATGYITVHQQCWSTSVRFKKVWKALHSSCEGSERTVKETALPTPGSLQEEGREVFQALEHKFPFSLWWRAGWGRPTREKRSTFSPWRTQSRSRLVSKGDCAPMERGAHAGAVCSWKTAVWNDPMLEPVLKNCRLWEDCTLEKSVKDCISWGWALSWNRGRKEQWRDIIHFYQCYSVREEVEESRVKLSLGQKWGGKICLVLILFLIILLLLIGSELN